MGPYQRTPLRKLRYRAIRYSGEKGSNRTVGPTVGDFLEFMLKIGIKMVGLLRSVLAESYYGLFTHLIQVV